MNHIICSITDQNAKGSRISCVAYNVFTCYKYFSFLYAFLYVSALYVKLFSMLLFLQHRKKLNKPKIQTQLKNTTESKGYTA